MGAERKSQYLDEKAKLATAYHEVFNSLIPFLLLKNRRVDMPLLPPTPMVQCHSIKSHVSLVDMPWVMWVFYVVFLLFLRLTRRILQTSQLPLDDRTSVNYKEYLAEIDVCMGGRVAEELSKSCLF